MKKYRLRQIKSDSPRYANSSGSGWIIEKHVWPRWVRSTKQGQIFYKKKEVIAYFRKNYMDEFLQT